MRGRGKSHDSRYIPNVLSLIREHRRFFLGTLFAALALRLFFFVYFPAVTDDSRVYANLAANWLQHGVYGLTQTVQQETHLVPTDARLPGYPMFLAAIFWLFGTGNFKAVLLAQILVDLGTCLIVADLARRAVSGRAARIAFVLTALCPFLANYAAAALSETLEIFFTALALDGAAAALGRMREAGVEMGVYKLWAATGAAIAACILLRPDGGILLAAVMLYLAVADLEVSFRQEECGGMFWPLQRSSRYLPWHRSLPGRFVIFGRSIISSRWRLGTPTSRMKPSREATTAG